MLLYACPPCFVRASTPTRRRIRNVFTQVLMEHAIAIFGISAIEYHLPVAGGREHNSGEAAMHLPTVVSLVALVVSIGSLSVAVWATRISKKSLQHAIGVQERSDQKQFEGLCAELLNQISGSRSVLDKTRIEIATLEADFRTQSSTVQVRMTNYLQLFSEYLPKVEQAMHQCDDLWNEISRWGTDKSYTDLMRARAILYQSRKDYEIVQESAMYAINVFKVKLELAKQRLLLHRSDRPEALQS